MVSQVSAFRTQRFAEHGITPLALSYKPVLAYGGWWTRYQRRWILVRMSRPTPDTLRSEVLIALNGSLPVWAIFDEGVVS